MDRTEEERDLARLARRIADGVRIDWEHESQEGTTTVDQVRHLKLVEQISDANRGLLLESLPFKSWGPLDLKRAAASGGFGDVFLARDRNLDTEVALKLFIEGKDPGAHEVFVDEARRLASVRHVNVVAVHGVDRHQGRTGLWMDWIDGDTLEALVDERGPYADDEAMRIGVELCRALAAIHAAGLVHRDVKLSNVMRERGGRIVLMDFGSSTRGGDGSPPLHGTPVYLPPEAYDGTDSGPLADIYSLGVLLYRLTSDGYPIEFGSVEAMRQAHRGGNVVPLRDRNPNLSKKFVRVVERAMHPDPAQRFSGAAEMEQALNKMLDVPVPFWKRATSWAAVLLAAAGITYVTLQWVSPAYEADAGFFRLTEKGTEERLLSGVRIEPGQRLFLDFETNRPSWVYVINADGTGEQNLLFPVPGIELENPVPSGKHTIPGEADDVEQFWNVTSAGGEEFLLVVASTKALDFIERRIPDLNAVVPGQPIPLSGDRIAPELRGIAGMSAAPERRPSSGPLLTDEIVVGVALRSASELEVRLWELALFNPE